MHDEPHMLSMGLLTYVYDHIDAMLKCKPLQSVVYIEQCIQTTVSQNVYKTSC